MGRSETGIETGRLAAMMAVICIHLCVIDGDRSAPWYEATNQLARFAVPFFFITMGYFSKIGEGRPVWRTALRLLILYAVWFALYAMAFGPPWFTDMTSILTGGAFTPLWFLPSAAVCLVLVGALHRFFGTRWMLAICFALYVAGMAFGSYSSVLFGHDFATVWDTRNGVTFGALFIALGVYFAQTKPRVSTGWSAVFLLAAALLQLAEARFLNGLSGVPMIRHDYLAATLPFGVAAFLLFRSLNGRNWVAPLARFGPLALGIYVIHPALTRALSHISLMDGPAQFFAGVIVVFAAAFAATWTMMQVPGLRSLVTTAWGKRPAQRALVPAE